MFLARQNAPTSAWIAIILAAVFIAFGLLACVANEIVKFAAEQDALDDAAYDRANGDVPSIPSFEHINPHTVTEA